MALPAASFLSLWVPCCMTGISASLSLPLYLAVGESWHPEDPETLGTKSAFSRRGKAGKVTVPGFPHFLAPVITLLLFSEHSLTLICKASYGPGQRDSRGQCMDSVCLVHLCMSVVR